MSLKERPVQKVVRLLQDMKSQLEKERDDDNAVYEQLSCWCKTNDKEKSESIAAAEAKIASLESAIAQYAAKITELKVKLQNTKDDINKNWEALKSSTELRMKEAKEFHEEEKDLLQSVDACKQAVVVLSKHHPELAQVKAVMKSLKTVKIHLVSAALSSSEQTVLKQFIGGANSFLAIPGFQSYAPQSGQIFGVLKQMQEDFEKNLAASQEEERAAVASFAALKAAKEAEIAAGKKQRDSLAADLADNQSKHAQAEEDLADTEAQLDTDTKFLLNLRKRCTTTDEEFAVRQKSRSEEIAAVADTISILNSDESFDAMDKSVNSFVQFTAGKSDVARAVRTLRKAASVSSDPRLAMIAVSAQLDAFVKVKAAIDEMVVTLNAEMADEVKHRDFCTAEFNQNDLQTEAKSDEKGDLEAKIAGLASDIDILTKEIETLNGEITEMQKQMKRATEGREAENADFQVAVEDQRVTQEILAKAKLRMEQKYAFLQGPGAAHIATSGTHTDPGNGPARFAEYEHNAGGNRIVEMLNSVITDSKKLENDTILDETDSQGAYEGFVIDSNKSITQKQKAIVDKSAAKAAADEAQNTANTDHAQAVSALQRLADYKAGLHKS